MVMKLGDVIDAKKTDFLFLYGLTSSEKIYFFALTLFKSLAEA